MLARAGPRLTAANQSSPDSLKGDDDVGWLSIARPSFLYCLSYGWDAPGRAREEVLLLTQLNMQLLSPLLEGPYPDIPIVPLSLLGKSHARPGVRRHHLVAQASASSSALGAT